MPVQTRQATTAELEARRLLSSSNPPDPQAALGLARRLKREHRFDLAQRVLAAAAPVADGVLRDTIAQQQALCTYKNPDLPAHVALDEADKILREQVGLGPSAGVETVALAGAIAKRRFQLDGSPSHLERSLGLYLRAHALDLARDTQFEGYPGINAAFLLDLLASREERDSKADQVPELASAAAARRVRARELRETIAGRLTERSAVDSGFAGNYFLVVTLGEALLANGATEEGTRQFERAGKIDMDDWERETTARQLAALARVLPGANGTFPEWARGALRALLGATPSAAQQEAALEAAVHGKVGLALSGGGFRASLFHIGLLARLAELDLLRRVEVISCVSGGSIVGAFYYLRLKKLLEEHGDDLEREQYVGLVEEVERDFRASVQRNLRSRMSLQVGRNLARLFGAAGSTIADMFDEQMYRAADPRGTPHLMRELRIDPGSRLQGVQPASTKTAVHFDPRRDNWRRSAKVPVLVLNATALNTGHDWQFTATFMGESPNRIDAAVDGNYRLRRLYYEDADAASAGGGNVRLADAVAASAAVPGLFDPIPVNGIYPEKTPQLVDGGVYDNQGIDALLEQGCSIVLVSDGSGQSNPEDRPSAGTGSVLLRSNSLLMSRVRIAQHQELVALCRSGVVRFLSFVHLKKGLTPDPIDWRNCDDPKQRKAAGQATTDYGISKQVQKDLAGMRTDLDCFHDAESFALMASAYRMAERDEPLLALAREISGGKALPASHPWGFLAVQRAMDQVYEPDPATLALGRLLRASRSRFGKLLDIAAPRWVRVALAVLGIVLLVAAALRLPRAVPVSGAAVAFIAGSLLLYRLLARGRPSFGTALAMIAAPAALADVLLLDRLYLRLGSVARLKRLGLNDAAQIPGPTPAAEEAKPLQFGGGTPPAPG